MTPSPAINESPISAHTIVSCTMGMGGLSGKVMACPEHPGRFYGRGKTGPKPVLQEKIEKSGRAGGLGWGQKVVGHMPCGAPRCRVTRGCFGDVVVVFVPQRSNACNTCRY